MKAASFGGESELTGQRRAGSVQWGLEVEVCGNDIPLAWSITRCEPKALAPRQKYSLFLEN